MILKGALLLPFECTHTYTYISIHTSEHINMYTQAGTNEYTGMHEHTHTQKNAILMHATI